MPLNDRGREQARQLAEVLTRIPPVDLILSSDLARAHETARIVATRLGSAVEVHTHPGLREANLGQAQGLTWQEIKARFGDETFERWVSRHPRDYGARYPGGESGHEVLARVKAAVAECLHVRPDARRVAVASHGGVMRRLICTTHWESHGAEAPHFPLENCIVYPLAYRATPAPSWELGGFVEINAQPPGDR